MSTEVTPPSCDIPIEKSKYHFIIIPDSGGSPSKLSSDDLEGLKKQAMDLLLSVKSGWCYFIIDGVVCHLAAPVQVFQLRLPDGTLTELRESSGAVFNTDDKFAVLTSVRSTL